MIEKGDDKNNNVAGHPVEDHDSAEDEVANDDVKGEENDDVDQAWAFTSTIRTGDGLPAIATACQRVTSELLDLSLARAPGHNPDPRAHGHNPDPRAHGHNPDPRAHGHTGKAHQRTNLQKACGFAF